MPKSDDVICERSLRQMTMLSVTPTYRMVNFYQKPINQLLVLTVGKVSYSKQVTSKRAIKISDIKKPGVSIGRLLCTRSLALHSVACF